MKRLSMLSIVGFGLLFFSIALLAQEQPSREDLERRLRNLKEGISQKTEERDESACVKEVFHKFCLGGYREALPAGGVSIDDERLIYKIDGDNVLLFLVENRVTIISREFRPGTWLNFSEILQELESLYGTGLDHSYYPAYASSPDDKETAVALGKAKALYFWDQGPWGVGLSWSDQEAVTLIYSHKILSEKQKKKGRGL